MRPHNVEHKTLSDTHAELVMYLDPTLFWFRGHFPIYPILPGVAQLDWVMHYAGSLLVPGKRFHSISVVKFQAPLLPGQTVRLMLEWMESRQVLSFTYQFDTHGEWQTASNGKIRLCQ